MCFTRDLFAGYFLASFLQTSHELHSLQFLDNEGIYSVGKEFGKVTYLFAK